MKDNIMTTKDLAEYLKLNEKTVIKMAQSGELPGFKIGSQWRFYLSTIDEYLQDKVVGSAGGRLTDLVRTPSKILPLSRLTDESCINLDIKSGNLDGALYELSQTAYEGGVAVSVENLVINLKKREQMLSTALANGTAIPHPRNPNDELFKKAAVVIGRSAKGVDFRAPGGGKTHLFFMSCAPDVVLHLNLLSKIATFLGEPENHRKVLSAKTALDVMKALLDSEKAAIMPQRLFYAKKER